MSLVALLGVVMLTSACAALTVENEQGTSSTPKFLPNTPPPGELLEPLGSILVLRAYSGPFREHADRDRLAAPDIVVFDDGRVVANIALVSDEPQFMFVTLSEEERKELVETLRAANIQPMAFGALEGGMMCGDCPTTILRTDISGETVEVAAEGLLTNVSEQYVAALPYPRGLIAIDRLLNVLLDRVRTWPSEPFVGELPEIPVAPHLAG